MEQEDLVLNLHGEIPSDADTVRCQTAALRTFSDTDLCTEYLCTERRTRLHTPPAQDS